MKVRVGKKLKWKHQPKGDLLNLHKDSILDCKIEGEWNISNIRYFTFSLKNHMRIEFLVEQMSFTES